MLCSFTLCSNFTCVSVPVTKWRGPDVMVIIRNNTPLNTLLTLYLPDVSVNEILDMIALSYKQGSSKQGPSVLERFDDHTLRCTLRGDVEHIPIPGGCTKNIPGLLSVEMPSSIIKGQLHTLSVQQYSGTTRQVTGSFQVNIPVKSKLDILPKENRKLSVLRYIAKSILTTDRWYPVFSRYLDQTGIRVQEFGGDPDKVETPLKGTSIKDEIEGEGEIPSTELPQELYTGKVSQILYDCFGDFEGFILALCHKERHFRSNEKTIEEIVTRACKERVTVTIYIHQDDKTRPFKIGLHCH